LAKVDLSLMSVMSDAPWPLAPEPPYTETPRTQGGGGREGSGKGGEVRRPDRGEMAPNRGRTQQSHVPPTVGRPVLLLLCGAPKRCPSVSSVASHRSVRRPRSVAERV